MQQKVSQASQKPKYRIPYRSCSIQDHTDQKLNFVCLNDKCTDNSLICSMCRDDAHRGHSIQPLKFYLETIRYEYQADAIDYGAEMQQLEIFRASFMEKLGHAVEKIADEFRKLEEDVMAKFEALRSQILENQSKKNKFMDFYNSLISQGEDNPQFLIQNYLPTKQIQNFQSSDPIEELGKKICAIVNETRDSLFGDSPKPEPVETNLKYESLLASSVIKTGNVYNQTQTSTTCQTTLCAFKLDLTKSLQNHRLKLKITKLKKNSVIHLGAIQHQFFTQQKHKAPTTWINATNTNKLYFFNSQAVTFGHTVSTLKTFSENSNIEVSMSGDVMKIAMKKNFAEFKIPVGVFYFFFDLKGQAEVEILFLKK